MLLLAKDSQWGWAILAAFGCHEFVLDWSDCVRRVQAKTFHQLLYVYQRAAPSLMLIKWVCCCTLSHRCHLPHLKPLLHSDSCSRLLIAHAQFQPPVFRGLRKSAKRALNLFVIHSVMLRGFCRNINASRLAFQWSSYRICRSCTPLPLPSLHPKCTKVWDRQVCLGFWYLFVCVHVKRIAELHSLKHTPVWKTVKISDVYDYSHDVVFGWLLLSFGQLCWWQ